MAKNYCFTLNNYTPEQEKQLQECEHFGYIVYGREIAPTTGTPHLQGYFQLQKKKRITWIKKHINNQMNLRIANGTAAENKKYCTKDGDYYENGTPTIAGSNTAALYRAVQECKTWNDVLQLEGSEKRLNYVREVWNNREPEKLPEIRPRPWQQRVMDILQEPADDRTIVWIYDPQGGKGKTYLCKYLMANCGAFYISPSKSTDIYAAYNNQRIILYDIPRSFEDQYINYSALEKLKDGILFSGKYTSATKYRKDNAHLIVFSNEKPDTTKFSADRLRVMKLK